MFCSRCSNSIVDCECGDIEERLERLSTHPNFVTSRCRECQKHRVDCTCDEYEPLSGDDE